MKTVRKVQKRRKFSEGFKKARIEDYESGRFTVLELCRMFKLSESLVYTWIYKYSNYSSKNIVVVEESISSSKKLKEFEKKIKELERIVGQKQIKIDYLEKVIDLANDDLGLDIKKNSSTEPSNGLRKTKSK